MGSEMCIRDSHRSCGHVWERNAQTEPIHWRISWVGLGEKDPNRALTCEHLRGRVWKERSKQSLGMRESEGLLWGERWEQTRKGHNRKLGIIHGVGRSGFPISTRCVLSHGSVEKRMSFSAIKSQNLTQILGSKITSHPKSDFRSFRFHRGGTTEAAFKHIQTRNRQSARELSHMTP